MESSSFVGALWPSPNTMRLFSPSPRMLSLISQRSKRYGMKRPLLNHVVHIRSEKKEGGFDVDRRQLLLSSSALGFSGLAAGNAPAIPFPAPDIEKCKNPPTGLPPCPDAEGGCCPPFSPGTQIFDFEYPKVVTKRTRPAAHLVDLTYVRKYHRALTEMKKLAPDDPRSFMQQARIHCAYCNGGYYSGTPSLEHQVHFSWFFAPFHRWYLYFFERILAKLIDDDTFALPFWNWDDKEGMAIPPAFTEEALALYNENRDPCHQPPKILNLNSPKSCASGNCVDNLAIVSTNMGATSAEEFHGSQYRYATSYNPPFQAGKLETLHNPMHPWAGSSKNPNREDMGNFYSAGRDPLFYCHHANVDRMWHIWNCKLKGKNYDDYDLLNSEFLFYDENKRLVRVKAGGCYNIRKLGYDYEERKLQWENFRKELKASRPITLRSALTTVKESRNQPTELTSPVTIRLSRPNPKRSAQDKEEAEEILCVEGIKVDMSQTASFTVFINLPNANADTPLDTPHFAGFFSHVGHTQHEMKSSNKTLVHKIGITGTLEDIGADEDEDILVTLVPEATELLPKSPIKFGSIKINFITK